VDDVVVGEDRKARCRWGEAPEIYRIYHDSEWGRPVADDRRVFEKLCLEGFQAGLSWLTILRKREAFRHAFAGFVPEVVADYGPAQIERLLADPGIVRHRGKIEAAVANARATVALQREGTSLAGLLWKAAPVEQQSPPTRLADIPASVPAAADLARRLKGRGFRFLGPTTLYAAMQSLGLVNDHLVGCHVRSDCQGERATFQLPPEAYWTRPNPTGLPS
jgi:DNA-3-methyladenine glycosylase I